MIYYTYIITNLINGRRYIGDHSTNNLNDNYLGSGILLKEEQKFYGKENFKIKILEFFNTKEEAYNAQKMYIKEYKTHISQGGYNKNWSGGQWPSNHSEETKIKISEAAKGRKSKRKGKKLSKTHIENISKGMMGEKNLNHKNNITEERKKILMKNLQYDRSGKNNGMYGKKHTPESKLKNRNSHLKENLSQDTIQKMSQAAKNRPKVTCEYCGKNIIVANYIRWHGNKCKLKK
jgi:hypothetical protein